MRLSEKKNIRLSYWINTKSKNSLPNKWKAIKTGSKNEGGLREIKWKYIWSQIVLNKMLPKKRVILCLVLTFESKIKCSRKEMSIIVDSDSKIIKFYLKK